VKKATPATDAGRAVTELQEVLRLYTDKTLIRSVKSNEDIRLNFGSLLPATLPIDAGSTWGHKLGNLVHSSGL
jgi:hypothetical protein